MTANPRANNVLVEALARSVQRGDCALSDTPGLLKRVLVEESWREFVTRRGQHVHYDRFADFAVTKPLAGLGADVDLVRRVVADDPEALDLLERALQNPVGTNLPLSNRQGQAPAGTTKAAALRRLRKDAPELHAEVLAGQMSAHAAMVKAGFRPRTVSVPIGRPESAAAALRRHLPPDELAKLGALLLEGGGQV